MLLQTSLLLPGTNRRRCYTFITCCLILFVVDCHGVEEVISLTSCHKAAIEEHTAIRRLYLKVLTFGNQHKPEFYLNWLVEEMLADLDIPIIVDEEFVHTLAIQSLVFKLIDPSEYETTSVLVVANRDTFGGFTKLPGFLNQLKQRFPLVGLAHVADEGGIDRIVNGYPLVDYVLRNYYWSHVWLLHDKWGDVSDEVGVRKIPLVWYPLGTKKGIQSVLPHNHFKAVPDIMPSAVAPFVKEFTAASQRAISVSFAGQSNKIGRRNWKFDYGLDAPEYIWSDARATLRAMEDEISAAMEQWTPRPPYFLWTEQFNDAERNAPVLQYQLILRASAVVLNPMGTNWECFRMYEALESGAIPILEAGEALTVFGDEHPFPVVHSWRQDIIPLLRELWSGDPQTNRFVIDEVQEEVLAWWIRIKRDKQQEVQRLVKTGKQATERWGTIA